MNVLSLFDGVSCGQLALQRAGIDYINYFASEIDKKAIQVTQTRFPKTIQLGDVTQIDASQLPKIDLIIGGSPCQGFSFAGKQLNFDDPRSKLFFEFVRLKNELEPKHFLLENVKMKKESLDVISYHMGVEPVFINSADFSAQNRQRFYWTNIHIEPWVDKGIVWKNIEESGNHLKEYKVNETESRKIMWGNGVNGKCPNLSKREKSWAVTTKQDRWANAGLVSYEDFCRYLTPLECERLQTMPDHYTDVGISKTARYHAIGNAWTVDVIAHIFKGLKNEIV
jgi:DNA (cytosine-5)-methyltransferase 3A